MDDTLSNSGNVLDREIGEISPNQSGRLVSVTPRPDLMDGSFIDLQVESGFVEDSVGNGLDSGTKADPAQDQASAQGAINRFSGSRRRTLDPMLIIALLVTLFIVALTLGFLLARAFPG